MEFLKILDDYNCINVSNFRKVILNDTFDEYYKLLLELKKEENELITLDEEIFGSNAPLKVGYCSINNSLSFKNYGEFVIYPKKGIIVINEYLNRQYGNGCIIREEQIVKHEYSTNNTCFTNEKIIITLRRLKKQFDDEIMKKIEKIDLYQFEKITRSSLHDRLFYAILENYDFISYFLSLEDIISLDITKEYEDFMKKLNILNKIAIMPTSTQFYHDLSMYPDHFKYSFPKPSLESAKFAVSTIISEVNKANEALNQHKEYEEKKKKYEDLKKLLLSKEYLVINGL